MDSAWHFKRVPRGTVRDALVGIMRPVKHACELKSYIFRYFLRPSSLKITTGRLHHRFRVAPSRVPRLRAQRVPFGQPLRTDYM